MNLLSSYQLSGMDLLWAGIAIWLLFLTRIPQGIFNRIVDRFRKKDYEYVAEPVVVIDDDADPVPEEYEHYTTADISGSDGLTLMQRQDWKARINVLSYPSGAEPDYILCKDCIYNGDPCSIIYNGNGCS